MSSHNVRLHQFLRRPVESAIDSEHGMLRDVVTDLILWSEHLTHRESREAFQNDIFWDAVSAPGKAEETRKRFHTCMHKFSRQFNTMAWSNNLSAKKRQAVRDCLASVRTEIEGFQESLKERLEVLEEFVQEKFRMTELNESQAEDIANKSLLEAIYTSNEKKLAIIDALDKTFLDGPNPAWFERGGLQ